MTDRIKRHPARFLSLGALLLIILWLGIKGWRIAQATQSLLNRQAEAETLLADGFTQIDPDAVEALVLGLRRDVIILKTETAVFMPLAPYLSWLPQVGPTFAASPALMEMADAGTETAVYALRSFKPALELLNENEASMELIPALLSTITEAQPELIAINYTLDKIIAARSELDNLDALPGRIRTPIELMDTWLPTAQDGLNLLPHLPAMMGMNGPRYYLILAQNADELRPTGGFISGVGLVEMENGRILDLNFLDAYHVDNWEEKPYDFPPQHLYDFMGIELFLFRDANFWPDFPTSAEKLMELFSYGQDTSQLDGVMALDQHFLQLFVAATGPITLPNSDVAITSENVIENLQAAWSIQEGQEVKDWIFNRKEFIGIFAVAIQDKIESDFTAIDPVMLTQNMLQALETKRLQIYIRDPAIAPVLSQLHWDGRLPTNPQHDFLMVVDTNVGYSKANIHVTQSLTYQVQIQEDNLILANLTANYQHTGEDIGEPCSQDVTYNLETASSYQSLVNKCYWPYLRIYTPPGSQLLSSSRHIVPGNNTLNGKTWDSPALTINDVAGLTTFANYMMLPRGQSLDSYVTYQLPNSIIQTHNQQSQYQLSLFKQAGTQPQPANIIIILPEKAQLDNAVPTPTKVEGNIIHFEFALEKDTVITINYH